jgi:hypothetical protein
VTITLERIKVGENKTTRNTGWMVLVIIAALLFMSLRACDVSEY